MLKPTTACLLAAGLGTRNAFAAHTVKGLLPVENIPLILHLIEKLPKPLHLVIAIGYRGELYREFMEHLQGTEHAPHQVSFVEVSPYQGAGSGPGASLLQCRSHLTQPFFLLNTDSWIEEPLQPSNESWIGVGSVENGTAYCLVETEGRRVKRLIDKPAVAPAELLNQTFTGLAYVAQPEVFFKGLENSSPHQGETQVAGGFSALIDSGHLTVKSLPSWKDVGTDALYSELATRGSEQQLLKTEEYTYLFEGTRVIKFHPDPKQIENRSRRAHALAPHTPRVLKQTSHFLSLEWIKGTLLSQVKDPKVFTSLLDAADADLLLIRLLSPSEQVEFASACDAFYRIKTQDRVREARAKFSITDQPLVINGVHCPPLSELLSDSLWSVLTQGAAAAKFHGDFQPENLLCTDQGARYLDWRTEFVGALPFGDRNYDLAKMLHALIVSGEQIRKGRFALDVSTTERTPVVRLAIEPKPNLLAFERLFLEWLTPHGYDPKLIERLTALIYLNISKFYSAPYGPFLYYLGVLLLHDYDRGRASLLLGRGNSAKDSKQGDDSK